MKLLDKIAKRLGYVPAETIPFKPVCVVRADLPLKTFASSVAISKYDLELAKENDISIMRWSKRKIVENLTNELVSCMDFVDGVDRDGNITITGRIRVIDEGLREF